MIALIWSVSLIALTATAVLVYKILITSNEFLSSEKLFPFKFLKTGTSRHKFYLKTLAQLNSKIKTLEDSNAYFEIQFSKSQLQINSVQDITTGAQSESSPFSHFKEKEEEDWEDMYYQENERKVQIENELDEALQTLENLNQKLLILEKQKKDLGALKSHHDESMLEMKSMQHLLESLQKKLDASTKREKELDLLLQKELEVKKVYAKIENENVRLRSETEDQKRQLISMHAVAKEYSKKLDDKYALQSQLGMYEIERNQKMNELKRKMENNSIFCK